MNLEVSIVRGEETLETCSIKITPSMTFKELKDAIAHHQKYPLEQLESKGLVYCQENETIEFLWLKNRFKIEYELKKKVNV